MRKLVISDGIVLNAAVGGDGVGMESSEVGTDWRRKTKQPHLIVLTELN